MLKVNKSKQKLSKVLQSKKECGRLLLKLESATTICTGEKPEKEKENG